MSNQAAESATALPKGAVNGIQKGPPGAPPSIARRAELLSEIANLDGKPEAAKEASKPAPVAKPVDSEPTKLGLDGDIGELERKAEPEAKAGKATADGKIKSAEAAEAAVDPDLQRRLAAVQKAEKRAKEEIARQRAELKAEADAARARIEKEWSERVTRAERFDSLKSRARYDADSLIEALGLADDDLEPVAQALYLRSKAGSQDPKQRAAADRALKDRAQRSEFEALRKEIDDIKATRAAEQRQAALDREVEQFLDRVVKRVGDDAPEVKRLLTKNAAKTRARLLAAAQRLAAESPDEIPGETDVIAALETARKAKAERRASKQAKREAAFMAKYGLDPATLKLATGNESKASAQKSESRAAKSGSKDSRSAKDELLSLWPE